MNNMVYSALIVLVAVVVTVVLRAIPFLIFRDGKRMPDKIKQVADLMPTAVISVLVIYCIKADVLGFFDVLMHGSRAGLVGVIATAVALVAVVLVHIWKRQTLLSIAVGTILYMILLRVLPLLNL